MAYARIPLATAGAVKGCAKPGSNAPQKPAEISASIGNERDTTPCKPPPTAAMTRNIAAIHEGGGMRNGRPATDAIQRTPQIRGVEPNHRHAVYAPAVTGIPVTGIFSGNSPLSRSMRHGGGCLCSNAGIPAYGQATDAIGWKGVPIWNQRAEFRPLNKIKRVEGCTHLEPPWPGASDRCDRVEGAPLAWASGPCVTAVASVQMPAFRLANNTAQP